MSVLEIYTLKRTVGPLRDHVFIFTWQTIVRRVPPWEECNRSIEVMCFTQSTWLYGLCNIYIFEQEHTGLCGSADEFQNTCFANIRVVNNFPSAQSVSWWWSRLTVLYFTNVIWLNGQCDRSPYRGSKVSFYVVL